MTDQLEGLDLDKLTPEEQDALFKLALSTLAKEDTPEGFKSFYYLVHGNPLPKYAEAWVEAIYKAHAEGIGSVLMAWRGSWKSTTISVTFTAFRIGHEPEKTNLIISANDDSADKITSSIARIIEISNEWKMVFPHVIPDSKRGWGAEGYWVIDSRIPIEEWVRQQAKVLGPTLVGAGYNSGRVIGKHPTGVLLLDDVHDERNSASARERAGVVKIVSDTILPTAVKNKEKFITWFIGIGTPWDEEDALHYLINTGQMEVINTPLMVKSSEGEPGAIFVDGRNRDGLTFLDIIGWWKLTTKARYNAAAVVSLRALSGLRGFARMYLLDLKAARVAGLKYYTYPHAEIDTKLPMYGGVDLATVLQKGRVDDPGRDYFSMGYGIKLPIGKLVVYDGILEQCTQAQAEDHLRKPQGIFPGWRHSVIEGDGSGETFYTAILMRNPGLRLVMKKTGGKAKHYRQEREMGPWLENGFVLISDAETPYLNALKKSLDDFPDGNNDIRDGLYWLCSAVPDILSLPDDTEVRQQEYSGRHKRTPNPFLAFGRR